jgi:transcription termination factor Rho
MTETTDTAPTAAAPASGARKGGLNAMLLPELKQLAGGLGIKATGMRKGALIEAIKAAQGGGPNGRPAEKPADKTADKKTDKQDRPKLDDKPQDKQQDDKQQNERPNDRQSDRGGDREDNRGRDDNRDSNRSPDSKADNRTENRGDNQGDGNRDRDNNRDNNRDGNRDNNRNQNRGDNQGGGNRNTDRSSDRGSDRNQGGANDRSQGGGNRNQGSNRSDEEDGSRRNRRRRGRDRSGSQGGGNQGGGGGGGGGNRGTRNEPDMQILDDDVLAPCAGILDLMDNYAFVRTSGYLPGPDDVYVSMSMVRKFGLRRGDAITGQVRQPREGERKEKYNPLVKLDTVNGADPEEAKTRVDFSKLTPLYPSERLRLETTATNMIGRVIDIASPIGKGQRGLIVSPSKAGKTMIMQSIANSITTNNPECHLMVVLVDERPEEVTDFERSVKGEVVSSTFDRPAGDHTIVAELAIERAKRLVELGHDVVVLLDGITRLGRAYNLAAPASGRILSGGVDSAALYPPKRFFGAARNIEDGGSLTILATALIESGSKMDEVIFEEFKGTGNMEIRLRRDFADKRIFPAIDAVQSGTRREELLMSKEELAIVWKLRRVLSALDGQQALELLLERLKKSQNNYEFLMQVQKTTPMAGGQDN